MVLALAGLVLPSASLGPAPGSFIDVTPADPVELVVPSIELKSKVIPIDTDPNDVLHPPADVRLVGWWKDSAKPGANHGQTLITGHTVHSGGGVMDRMGDVKPGDRVQVITGEAKLNYKVREVKVFTIAQVAEHAADLFGQDRERGRLVLVTCTDWKNGKYQKNIIVFADPDGVHTEEITPTDTPVEAMAR
ncbi:class F sortase [Nocardioides sp. AE5]|uniref:class F sortase n=1 Tax=Nocardioides sp. AE5 TaxID=2962573 RepID=UPI002880ECEC|nr:class F sortase [Nocardioides sp. AE5]MDT0200439.1 class F sortase [Nocardioides sp. AE5]